MLLAFFILGSMQTLYGVCSFFLFFWFVWIICLLWLSWLMLCLAQMMKMLLRPVKIYFCVLLEFFIRPFQKLFWFKCDARKGSLSFCHSLCWLWKCTRKLIAKKNRCRLDGTKKYDKKQFLFMEGKANWNREQKIKPAEKIGHWHQKN